MRLFQILPPLKLFQLRCCCFFVISETFLQIAKLRAAFNTGATKSLSWRLDQLFNLKDMLEDNIEALAEALHQDLGRPRMASSLCVPGCINQYTGNKYR